MSSAKAGRLASLLSSDGLPSPEEQQAAWDSLSPEERQIAVDVFEDQVLEPAIAGAAASGPPEPGAEQLSQATPAQLAAGSSSRSDVGVAEHLDLISDLAGTPVLGIGSPSEDGDGDALPETLENAVAQSFMPEYHVSGGEKLEAGFTRFADQSELQPGPVLRQQPPLVHTRVTGVGGRTEDGVLHGYLRIDYLTIWNLDTGYDNDPICTLINSAFLLKHGHPIDVERSALLVAAPVVWSGGHPHYNSDPANYRAFFQFTTAHEDFPLTFADRFLKLNQPSAPGDHGSLALFLAKSKHGTYPFNPDGHNVLVTEFQFVFVEAFFIDLVLFVDDVFFGGGEPLRARRIVTAVLLLAVVVTQDCFTESFTEQGGTVPTDPLNIGEHRQPLPGFSWAAHGDVRQKLLGPPVAAPRGTRVCGHTWTATKVFQPNEGHTGCRGLFIMQGDGNLVYYDEFDIPRWATGTDGWPGAFAVFQDDGNLVVYTAWGHPLWASNTGGRAPGGLLAFQGDGNLVIYAAAGHPVWSRHGGLIPPPPPCCDPPCCDPPPPPCDPCVITY